MSSSTGTGTGMTLALDSKTSEPGYQFEQLESLTWGIFPTNNKTSSRYLKGHKSTPKKLCLNDVTLRSTSRLILLPDIRQAMKVGKPRIYCDIYERDDDGFRDELNEYVANREIQHPLDEDNGRFY
ncbi:hypothetical protein F5Y06DRAFT_295035 [Hypoxylon sp. FL0890]|nr:hypothetical protein F5Y06DRAFT_295035 [Hypoxylon sp. FL0890]